MTGNVWNSRGEIKDVQSQLTQLHKKTFAAEPADDPKPAKERPKQTGNTLSDEQLVRKAKAAENGEKFKTLWEGNHSAYDSPSEAVQALCCLLAYWTAKDAARMDKLFRDSKLKGDKWDEKRGETTWGANEIKKAIKGCKKAYQPKPELPCIEDFKKVEYNQDNIRLNNKIIIGSGFFERYIEYAEQTTDAPQEFLFTSMLTAVAGVLGNKVYLRRGARVYPNLYTLLVAPSTTSRKSTCLDIASFFVSKLGLMLPTSSTPEAFHEYLARKTSYGFWKISEFGSFLKGLGRTYMAGFKEDLTDFYDVPDERTRQRKAQTTEEKQENKDNLVELKIFRPAISICAGSTIVWLQNNLEEGDIGGGWLARFVFSVLGERTTPKVAWFDPMDENVEDQYIENIRKDLKRIDKIEGEYTVIEEAKKIYITWYNDRKEELIKQFSDRAKIEPFVERYATVVLKVAMIMQASKNSNLVVSEDSMLRAIGITEYFIRTISYLLAEELTTSWIERQCRLFVQVLRENNGIANRRDIQQRLRAIDSRQFEVVVQTLLGQGEIEAEQVQGLRGPPSQAYRLPEVQKQQ